MTPRPAHPRALARRGHRRRRGRRQGHGRRRYRHHRIDRRSMTTCSATATRAPAWRASRSARRSSAPVLGTDSFRGIDRGANPTRLAGARLDDTSLNAEVALGRLAVKISKTGKSHNVDEGFLNPTQFFNAAQRLNAKVEYSDGGGTANYGFQYIMIHTAAGSLQGVLGSGLPARRAPRVPQGLAVPEAPRRPAAHHRSRRHADAAPDRRERRRGAASRRSST
jgi:hypothetical protein